MYLNKKAVREFFHDKSKHVSEDAIFAIDRIVENIMQKAIISARAFITVKESDIPHV